METEIAPKRKRKPEKPRIRPRKYLLDLPCKTEDCPERSQGKDGWCKRCRVVYYALAKCKYPWTPEMDSELTMTYRIAKSRQVLSDGCKYIARKYKMPRYIVTNRAQTLGLASYKQRPWRPEEERFVRDQAGFMSLTKIAKELHRSDKSVKNKMFKLSLQAEVHHSSYSRSQFREKMGVSPAQVIAWVNRGWLDIDADDRITDTSIQAFVWDHMSEYRFAKCEEWWLKTMLNPEIGKVDCRRRPQSEAA